MYSSLQQAASRYVRTLFFSWQHCLQHEPSRRNLSRKTSKMRGKAAILIAIDLSLNTSQIWESGA